MFVNRFTDVFEQLRQPEIGRTSVVQAPQQSFLPMISLQDLYQAAAERAYRDHELDKLFNADYYGDHGSGI